MCPIAGETWNEPVVPGLITSANQYIDLNLHGTFDIQPLAGQDQVHHLTPHLPWRIKLNDFEPAQYSYSLEIGVVEDKETANWLAAPYVQQGLPVLIDKQNTPSALRMHCLPQKAVYHVRVGQFNSNADAVQQGWPILNQGNAVVAREKIRDARYCLEIFDGEYESVFNLSGALRLIPKDRQCPVNIYSGHAPITLRGSFEIHAENRDTLLLIQPMGLETYTANILQSISSKDWPESMIKAFSVAIRNDTITCLNQGNGVDDTHRPFYISTRAVSADIKQCVQDTVGQYLVSGKTIAKVGFTINCGGALEFNHLLNSGSTEVSSKPNLHDREMRKTPVDIEPLFQQWIDSEHRDNHCCHAGDAQTRNRNYRWQCSIMPHEIAEAVASALHVSLGHIYDMFVASRRTNGCVESIELIGSRQNLKLKGDFMVYNALFQERVKSACFYIEHIIGMDHEVKEFILHGAGVENIRGLCVEGAKTLAAQGIDYVEILNHYFSDFHIKTIYTPKN